MARIALMLGILGSLLASASSFQYLDFKMLRTEADPFPFFVDDRAGAPLPADEVERATLAAFQTWQALDCAAPAFLHRGGAEDAGITEPASVSDAFSVAAIWVTDAADPAYAAALGGGVAAAAAIPVQHGGALETCDIFLNAVDFTWSAADPTPLGALDLQTLLLHEVGHCMGLDHTLDPPLTVMDPALPFGASRRELTDHDAEHLCRFLPREGAVGAPCQEDGGCGDTLRCLAPALGDGGTGAPFCTRGCSGEDCPFPFACGPTTRLPGETHACLSASSGGVTRVGAPCASADVCGSEIASCLASGWPDGYCTQTCSSSGASCPAGAACDAALGACLQRCRIGLGGCREGYVCAYGAEPQPLCSPACATDLDCQSGTRCRTCDGVCLAEAPGPIGVRCSATQPCDLGRTCLPMPGAPEGLCLQPCESACATCPQDSACARVGPAGERFCLATCEGGCPEGTRCGRSPDGVAVCLPGCQSELDCPVGNVCRSGECENPFALDAGVSVDAGATAPALPAGCGCHTSAMSVCWAFFLWIFLGARRR